MSSESKSLIKAIIGLGNPGRQYESTRHNIGFKVVDVLCERFGGQWKEQNNMQSAQVIINGKKILLITPQTFMNSSGRVMPFLQKQGIGVENILVAHDEMEIPFGSLKMRSGGSARGHNGLKSFIEQCGQDFMRLRFGIGRPDNRDDVADYVLANFTESSNEVDHLTEQAADMIEQYLGD